MNYIGFLVVAVGVLLIIYAVKGNKSVQTKGTQVTAPSSGSTAPSATTQQAGTTTAGGRGG